MLPLRLPRRVGSRELGGPAIRMQYVYRASRCLLCGEPKQPGQALEIGLRCNLGAKLFVQLQSFGTACDGQQKVGGIIRQCGLGICSLAGARAKLVDKLLHFWRRVLRGERGREVNVSAMLRVASEDGLFFLANE